MWANAGLFCLFWFFPTTILQKIVDFGVIQTPIVGVEGEHANHSTTTTAPPSLLSARPPANQKVASSNLSTKKVAT